jgi:hypothetical protein
MNAREAAQTLDGSDYGKEGSAGLFAEMKAAGLVAAFGASDDLIEFRGAIDDEQGAGEHSTHSLARKGLLKSECDCDDCPYYKKIEDAAPFIEAIWDDGGFSWRYCLVGPDGSPIAHEKFLVMEDGDTYCEGIVFALADLPE